ncbi:hypothetical protein OF897_04085 [Chryseobacterium formosus]|uniref:RiboL-PSP-HEPN domain-containing protein n=1 Tax=Chryseobacterium formosus TaxID=1537363 RepID=A0ABT3XLV9_9FLAO|nr:hypothetical protein [Chryseobacterium formosus]MCX8523100.1 hypothetical protein [Chryseobacterium formosus]
MAVIKNRIKISASYNSFIKEIIRLEKFDFQNHQKFNSNKITKAQLELMVESIFFAGFRSYEGFIREIFILYCLEKKTLSKKNIKSYLKPKNFEHSEQLLKSSMPFLDWTSPESIIARSELYLEDGYPIKLPYTTNLQQLKDYKRLRNHIAHNSVESEIQYEKLVRAYNSGVRPMVIPTPGKFLMLTSRLNPRNYLLLDFFDLMKQISIDMT